MNQTKSSARGADSLQYNTHFSAARLDISPAVGWIDSSLDLRISGLPAHTVVTLRARVRLAEDRAWISHASFFSDDQGRVDVGEQVPAEGSYHVADANGLIWSLTPEVPWQDSSNETRFIDTGLKDYRIHFSLTWRGQTLATAEIVRQPIAPGVSRTEIRDDGLVGTLFVPAGPGPYPAIIVLPGSGGGIPESLAALYASYGYGTLALAYFKAGEPGEIPADLASIPLEYFETALRWVQRHPKLDSRRLVLNGTSRGGELALLLGSRFPEIAAVIAWVPSSHVWGGLTPEHGVTGPLSAWTWRGEPVAFVPRSPEHQDLVERDGGISKVSDFLRSIENDHDRDAAIIPVERIAGPILLISGTDDALLPSAQFSRWIEARLQAKQFPHRVTHLSFEEAGHTLGPPGNPATSLLGGMSPDGVRLSMGGTVTGVARARAELWPEVLTFLARHHHGTS